MRKIPAEITLMIKEKSDEDRKESNKLYAEKIVERIVFAGLALFATLLVSKFFNLGIDRIIK